MTIEGRKVELAALLQIEEKKQRLKAIEQEMAEPSFWQDHQRATKISQEFKYLSDLIERFELSKSEADLAELEDEVTFTGHHDQSAAFISVHAGAGGTEAQDWAEMLVRMYLRWAEHQGFKSEILDRSPGEEAGVKSATIYIKGFRGYGLLKGENGVHRLVRISPFDADKARHTSFALVEVVPEVEKNEIEIKAEEIKIDVYRSTGAGGQSVNTTDSAVRITHLPTNIVVTCQNERSQLQNKAQALKILQAKLQLLEDEKQRADEQKLKGEPVLASWGNQIRSYVLQPYQLVKDNRTGFETSAVADVLDGKIDQFLESYRKYLVNK